MTPSSGEGELLIDGSMGEGGGQILRTAVALAALLRKPLRVKNIRAKRRPPGLRPQHLTAVRAVTTLSEGTIEGLSVGSTEISFKPTRLRSGNFVFDAGTAGSTTLMLQSLLPVMCFAPAEVNVEVRGGTNNPMAPPVEYIEKVLLPALRAMGLSANVELLRRGFYPRGMGIVRARSEPCSGLRPIIIEDCDLEVIEVFAYSCNLPEHVVNRMASKAEQLLRSKGYKELVIETEALQRGDEKCSVDPGAGIILVAHMKNGLAMGVDALGEKGLPAERVAEKAVQDLLSQLATHTPVDKHLGDQLVLWASLAEGESRYKVSALTSHTSTSIDIARLMTGAVFEVENLQDSSALIRCVGIGLKRTS